MTMTTTRIRAFRVDWFRTRHPANPWAFEAFEPVDTNCRVFVEKLGKNTWRVDDYSSRDGKVTLFHTELAALEYAAAIVRDLQVSAA